MNNRPLDPSEMTDAQRTAWQNSWMPDEAMVAHFPEGYWTHLIFMAAIEPANDVFMAIFNEALKLGEGRTEGRYSEAKLLTRWSVFWELLRLNPSMLKAIKLCRRYVC